jgi:hypothetical protein
MRIRWITASTLAIVTVIVTTAWVRSQPADTQPSQENLPYVQTESLLVVVTPGRDTVWGYSKEVGKWFKTTLTQPVDESFRPMSGRDVVIVQDGKCTYALGKYSQVGWSTLVQDRPPQVVVMDDWAIAEAGDHIYAFSAKIGKWSGIDIKVNRSFNWDQ